MDLHAEVARLVRLSEPGVVTLTLDVSKSGALPPATRVFVKDEALPKVADAKVAARVRRFIESDLRRETNGLYLAAGKSVWAALQLAVPLRNFAHVGSAPYVAPLLEAAARSARAHVVRISTKGAVLHEVELGVWREVDRIEPREPSEKSAGRRNRHDEAAKAADVLVRDAGKRVAALAGKSGTVLVVGDHECFPALREFVPSAVYVGATPRSEKELADRAELALDRAADARVEHELLEFHDRRAQGHLVAIGPREVLEQMSAGRAARIFLSAGDPVPGVACASCGSRYPEARASCEYCDGAPAAASMTQEVIAHALAHPPLAITFVPARERWLRDIGGMAALLGEKSARTKR